jgi:formylglycine-generating enzyme required for sulfatase activity
MVRVPCGRFVMGSDPDEGPSEEQPEHVVRVSTFCIDRTEVTQGAWAECVARGACADLPADCDAARGADHPVVCVTPEDAETYCRSLGRRLPREAEWEKAARGGCEIAAPEGCGSEDERTYPWGEEAPTCDRANLWPRELPEPCVGAPDVVGARRAGASPYGALDMAGNVAEWALDDEDSFPQGQAFARGDYFRSSARTLRVAARAVKHADPTTGFRCAWTP